MAALAGTRSIRGRGLPHLCGSRSRHCGPVHDDGWSDLVAVADPLGEVTGRAGRVTALGTASRTSRIIGALLVLYVVLYRFALVPRALAAFGLLAVMLQLTAVAGPLFGHPVVVLVLAPLGVSQLALALWLIIKGFA